MRILSVVGNRPQFVKSAPLSLALRERGIEEVVLHTGQHYDPELSAVFFDELELAPPRYRLEAGSGTHAEQTGRMLPGIEGAVLEERPDAVLVYGDTNTTLAGALAAAKLLVPVALLLGFGNGLGSGIVMTLGADFAPARGRAEFLGVWRLVG